MESSGVFLFLLGFIALSLKGLNIMIKVELKGGVVNEYEAGISAAEIAKSLGAGLYKAVCACKRYI